MKNIFRIISAKISTLVGTAYAFVFALLLIVVWGFSGPAFNYSDTWQLVINTTTTIVTFLMVFLIQNTQNRDSRAMQLKLDELIRTQKTARENFVGLEDITDEELLELSNEFKELREQHVSTPAIQKLHQKIEQEHAKRLSLRNTASMVVGAVLNPLKPRDSKEAKAPLSKNKGSQAQKS